MAHSLLDFHGSIQVRESGEVTDIFSLAFHAAGVRQRQMSFDLKANTTFQVVSLGGTTPVTALIVECEKPIFLRIGAASNTTRVSVRGLLAMQCSCSTISLRNQVTQTNRVNVHVLGGKGLS